MKVAALFVEVGGPYWWMGSKIDFWGIDRDARLYSGPWPVIAHPPCERWGSYFHGGSSCPNTKSLGDDGGCFESALRNVRRWGGVLEHPRGSHAWSAFDLPKPPKEGGWISTRRFEWSCCVDQAHYGHVCRKRTWLFCKAMTRPIDLKYGDDPSRPTKFIDGSARNRYSGKLEWASRRERRLTPSPFAQVLLEIAINSRFVFMSDLSTSLIVANESETV